MIANVITMAEIAVSQAFPERSPTEAIIQSKNIMSKSF